MEPNQPNDSPAPTTRQLCELAGCQPAFLHRHRDLIPPTATQPGALGRPANTFDLEHLAELALQLTAGLTEAECRLRLGFIFLARERRAAAKRNKPHKGDFYRAKPLPDGGAELLPIRSPNSNDVANVEGL